MGETGKIEMQFRKTVGGVWENYGVLKQTSSEESTGAASAKFVYRVVKKTAVTHNTYLVEYERNDGAMVVVPVGKHVRVCGKIQGKFSKSYDNV